MSAAGGPGAPTRRPEAPRPGLAVVAAGLAAVCAWVWAAGEVAGRLQSGAWPPVPLSTAPFIAARVIGAWPRLRRAWPAPVRASLPGGAGLAVTAAGLALLAAAVAAAGLWGYRRLAGGLPAARPAGGAGRLSPARRSPDPGARWARSRDLAPLRRRRGDGPRLVVGTAGRRPVATEARHSVLVVGPTQSGKTSGLAIPAILEWDGPVVATSVKDDLAASTARWRARRGQAWVFDPTAGAGPPPRACWSPLSESQGWTGAQKMAATLVEAAPARSGMTDGAFWFAAAAKLLAPLLLAAATAGAGMADVVRWNDTSDTDEPLGVLADAGEIEAVVALQASASRDERLRSSVATTLETVLAPFADPAVASATSCTDIDVHRLVTGTDTLYLCGPSHEQFRVQGLFAGLVASVVGAAVEHVHATGRPLDPPLLLVLDEAANIAPLRDLDTLASTAAGMGIQLVTVCQDLAQLAARYGQDRSRTIANNHRAKLILSGVSDLATLDLVSGLAGEAAVRETTESADLRDGRRTRTQTVAYRRLAPTDSLRRIPPGQGVLVYGHLPAVRVRLRPWYRDPVLRRRAGAGGQGDAAPSRGGWRGPGSA